MKNITYDQNGLPLSGKGLVPYLGVCFTEEVWHGGDNRPYIAAVGIPSDYKHLMPSKGTAIHLGSFSDPRDAAWVSAKFMEDVETNMVELSKVGFYNWLPSESIPVWQYPAVGNKQSLPKVKLANTTPVKKNKCMKITSSIDALKFVVSTGGYKYPSHKSIPDLCKKVDAAVLNSNYIDAAKLVLTTFKI